jgi:hypothetical protein
MQTAQRMGSAAAAGRARLLLNYAPFLANRAYTERRSRCPPGAGVRRRRDNRFFIYEIKATKIRLQIVAEIRLGQMLPVREAAQPPTIPIANHV